VPFVLAGRCGGYLYTGRCLIGNRLPSLHATIAAAMDVTSGPYADIPHITELKR
jgi:hypothetical protein